MKLNTRVYKKLTGEPYEVQDIDGRLVEFHKMDDSPFLFQYASKGRFAIWASDGVNYKVLIESTYHDAMREFYSEGVNRIWLDFLERIGAINKRINTLFIIPTILFYMVIAFFASAYLQDQIFVVLLVLLGVIIVTNSVQNRIVSKRVREENTKAQDAIRNLIGSAEFDRLIHAQERHYQTYFQFKDKAQGAGDQPAEGTDGENGEALEFEEDLKPYIKNFNRRTPDVPETANEGQEEADAEPLDFEEDLKPFIKGQKAGKGKGDDNDA